MNLRWATGCLVFMLCVSCGGPSSTNRMGEPGNEPGGSGSGPTSDREEDPDITTTTIVQLEDWLETGGSYGGFNTYIISGRESINFNQAGDYADYDVRLSSGIYRVEILAGTAVNETPTSVQLHLDNCLIATSPVAYTGSWDTFEYNTITEELVVYEDGDHRLRVIGWGDPGTWQWNADRIRISRLNDAPVSAPECVPPPDQPEGPGVEEGFENGEVIWDQKITADFNGVTYAYHVFLPDAYEENPNTEFDLLITTDAQSAFSTLVAEIGGKQRALVVVGIKDEGRRAIDYLPPVAEQYVEFLKSQLVPALLSEYRVKRDTIGLEGFSAGGLLVGIALLTGNAEAPVFKNLFSYDGAFLIRSTAVWQLMDARRAAGAQMPVHLVLTGGNSGDALGSHVERFAERLSEAGFSGLTVSEFYYPLAHVPTFSASLEDSFDAVYGVGGPKVK